jgi:hypothetical protein
MATREQGNLRVELGPTKLPTQRRHDDNPNRQEGRARRCDTAPQALGNLRGTTMLDEFLPAIIWIAIFASVNGPRSKIICVGRRGAFSVLQQ